MQTAVTDTQPLAQVIKASRDVIVEHWLQVLKKEPEIASIRVSDCERSARFRYLFDIATSVAESKELIADHRNAYLRYGAILFKEGYTIPLLVREAKLLQASVAHYMKHNCAAIEIIHLVPDTLHFMATVDSLWKIACRGFIQQAHAEKVVSRRRVKRILKPDAKAS